MGSGDAEMRNSGDVIRIRADSSGTSSPFSKAAGRVDEQIARIRENSGCQGMQRQYSSNDANDSGGSGKRGGGQTQARLQSSTKTRVKSSVP